MPSPPVIYAIRLKDGRLWPGLQGMKVPQLTRNRALFEALAPLGGLRGPRQGS